MHDPVLLNEVVDYLYTNEIAHSQKRTSIIDATVGFGGHAKEFVKRGVFVLGIDTDASTLKYAEEELKQACPSHQDTLVGSCFKLIHGNFKDIDKIARSERMEDIYGILIDLGVSTPQLTSEVRGLSFGNQNADLDMRLDTKTSQVRGRDLLNALNEKQLFDLFHEVMEYRDAKRISHHISEERKRKGINTVGDFLSIIQESVSTKKNITIHPATLPFMALRMAVNSELDNLKEVLPRAYSLLEKGGRLTVISFHSGEDRIVKDFYKEMAKIGKGYEVTKKPILPSVNEIEKNPKARSAKLRVIEKV